jgi:Ca2+-binding RTX toxin-like protein
VGGGWRSLEASVPGPGADVLMGEDGNDRYFVENSAAVVIEAIGQGARDTVRSLGTYVLAAGSEVEILETYDTFSTTALDLVGNEFDQTIAGNDGENTLVGGMGRDVMTGNGGRDTFVWRTTAETGVTPDTADVVTDFNPGLLEFLVLTPIDADETVAGNQDFQTFVGIAAFTAPGQIRYFTDGGNTYIELNTDAVPVDPSTGAPEAEAMIRLDGLYAVQGSWFVL